MHRSSSAEIYEIAPIHHDQPTNPLAEPDGDMQTEGRVSWAYPEGGWEAWTCLLGSSLIMFPSFGFQTAVGSVQDYISTNQLAEYTVRDVGWITAILAFLTLFLGVQVGPLFDRYGPRVLLVGGSLANIASYLLLAQCRAYWHFVLCLSVLGGISSAVITTVSIAVLSHWFNRRRALASGICMGGSSAGGAIIPLLLRKLFPNWDGHGLSGRSHSWRRATADFGAFRSPRLCFLAVAVFSFEFVIFGCAALLPTYVRYAGFPLDVQFYSLTLLNSMSFLGRVLPGLAADQLGRFNILLALVVMTLLVMSTVWLPFGSRGQATLYAVVAIFGFGSGGWLSLAPVCAGQLCRTEEYGRFYGTIYSVAAFGVLLTVPIGGELLQSTTPQVLIGFYSAVLMVGLMSVVMARWALLDWRWKWRVKL
ncbi:putative MFS monocarboxylate transporter [Aspergillus novofumigatus IBT 16806]|uniref:Monocarboxylate permease-like protein, mch4 n=1 Tax=Aspergillus novofumigatus (strain IBT 16806) TaxID=1392255 RepID=A0A2I1CN81_ASPN1|nr:monocarboxylate permease-like protein, mch4 [Aspergillus novofumigatus IBT 16806]PKX99079.1 monocarboxylate permease-like protein, mch4 [Aspergillus novofumigatus IBT 16806]